MSDSETIGIRLKKKQADQLRELAREKSFKEHRRLTLSGLIKEAIEKSFPERKNEKNNKI